MTQEQRHALALGYGEVDHLGVDYAQMMVHIFGAHSEHLNSLKGVVGEECVESTLDPGYLFRTFLRQRTDKVLSNHSSAISHYTMQ